MGERKLQGKEATKNIEEREKATTKEKAKEHHNGPSRRDGATQEKEATAITTVKTTKAKDTKVHTTKLAKTTAKEKEHATNAAGAATTLQNAEWLFGNYTKESLKKSTTTRWKRSTHKIEKTTRLQVMQTTQETVARTRMGLQSGRTRLVEL